MTVRHYALAAALASLAPADPAEEEARQEILALLAAAGDPFDRHRHDPGHVTASAFVLHHSGDRLLLIHHRKLGRWLQPGGHVDPGDASVWEAAVREVEEETGLRGVTMVGEVPFDVDAHRVHHDGHTHRHFDVRWLVRASGDPQPGDGVDGVRWATLDELEQMEPSLQRPARKALGLPTAAVP